MAAAASQRPGEYDRGAAQVAGVLQPTRRLHSRASTFTLGMRGSLDFGAAAGAGRHARAATAGSNISSSDKMAAGAGDDDGVNGTSSSARRWGTVSTASLGGRFGTVASSSAGSNENGKPGRAAFSLGGLFSPSSKNGSKIVDAGDDTQASADRINNSDSNSREEALMQAVDAANDEHTPWEISIAAVPEPDKLFLPHDTAAAAGNGPSGNSSASTAAASTTSFGNTFARILSPNSKGTSKKRAFGRPGSRNGEPSPSQSDGSMATLLALYVTTGTSSLTLYRSLQQIGDLDSELRLTLSDSMPIRKPSLLLGPSRSVSPASGSISPTNGSGHGRKRSVFSTITLGFASPSKRGSRTPIDRSRSPLQAGSTVTSGKVAGASQLTFDSIADVSAASQPAVDVFSGQQKQAPEVLASQLSNLSNYLSALSTIVEVRRSETWRQFFVPRDEDSSSSHLEGQPAFRQASQGSSLQREPKRIKSEASLPLSGHSPVKKDARAQLGQSANRPDDSGIGGDTSLFSSQGAGSRLSATAMKREPSAATTGSSMSVFVEDVPSGAVGDPEVLAYMNSIAETEPSPEPNPAPMVEQTPIADPTGYSEHPTSAQAELDGHDWNSLHDICEQDEATASPVRSPSPVEESVPTASESAPLSATTAVDTLAEYAAMHSPAVGTEAANREAPFDEGPLTPASDDEEATAHIEAELEAHMVKLEQEVQARKAFGHPIECEPEALAQVQDFEILRVLGKGCAGKVLLARRPDREGQLYAIKAIHKRHVLAHRELAHTLTEQKILREIAMANDNPFVVRLSWSFQDAENLFLVLDFHSGGDLATQLSRFGRLGKDRTRFYAAEIVEGLEGLHALGVVYRDLKPENILLDALGHIVLTDFGLSKQFERKKPQKGPSPPWLTERSASSPVLLGRSASPDQIDGPETTTSFCGTAEYLAPEVLLGSAYSYPVDLWSLGTMVYEMLMGVTPFYNEDHGIMYRRVLHEQLKFDDDYLDSETRAFLRGLLQKDPAFRMTVARVKKCKYFEAIDWEYVHFKRYIPPFIPPLSSADPADTQNFDECFLNMDTGFVDEDEEAEDAARLRSSGKEPDKPFDEFGRDVFEKYGFSGAFADPNEEEEGEDDDAVIDQADEGERGSIIDHGEMDPAAEEAAPGTADRREESAGSSQSSPSTSDDRPHFRNDSDEPEGYETGPTSASMTDDDQSKHTKDASGHPRMLSNGLASLAEDATEEYSSQTSLKNAKRAEDSEATHERSTSPRMSLEYQSRTATGSPKAPAAGHKKQRSADIGRKSVEMPRNSVELPRMPMSATAASPSSETKRHSGEYDEWDMVEAGPIIETAQNGGKGRKRLLAGPTIFAKGGVLDKYKLQMKPNLSRSNTPTRSYTSRTALNKLASIGSRQSSSTNVNQLSPSPSVGEADSRAPSVELPSPPNGGSSQPRLRAPKLLRASTEWMSSSLPASPTPRFRIKRSKKATDESAASATDKKKDKGFLTEGVRASTPVASLAASTASEAAGPAGSVDSAATLPLEASNAVLQPLTRVPDRIPVREAGEV